MKALSLWQPWASAIAIGAKTIETRSWQTSYRGPLLIHAARRKQDLDSLAEDTMWKGVFGQFIPEDDFREFLKNELPFGAIIAVCELVNCHSTDHVMNHPAWIEIIKRQKYPNDPANPDLMMFKYSWSEYELGDFGPNRYGWLLNNVKPLKKLIPYQGRQGLFDVPDEIIKV